jgi:RNA polymerase sigma factor (sigma-70 family)
MEMALGLLRGSQEMFGMIYEKYHHALYLNVMKLIEDPVETQDIVQDTFLTLWSRRKEIDVERPIGGWLFTVSYHRSVDLLKKRLRQPAYAQPAEDDPEELNKALVASQWSLVEEAIDNLPPQKKRVFQLCKLEQRSYEEAAAELGISKYTVNEYLKEGMVFVRKYVREKAPVQLPITLLLLKLGLLI